MSTILLHVPLLAFSVVLLWKGADSLVDAAARIGRRFRVSDLTIGLTVVAFGTSAPEFAVTISAAWRGQADVSVGNIVGSNIFNLGFVLGGCVLVTRADLMARLRRLWTRDRTTPTATEPWPGIPVARVAVHRDGMLLIGASVALLVFISDLTLEVWEGAALFGSLGIYLIALARRREASGEEVPAGVATRRDGARLSLALVAVVGGGHLLVLSASALARTAGVSDWVISVTIVAAGTSAPELVTSLAAAAKGHAGMSVGNLIGSDLFNVLGVLGLAGLLGPLPVADSAISSVTMLVGMCVLTVIFMRTGWRLSRAEGATLILVGLVRWGLDFAGP